jgi:lipoate-protein ligase A
VDLDEKTIQKIRELETFLTSNAFLFKKTPRIPEGVKITEGIDILYGLYKAKGGLIRTAEEVENKKVLKDIVVSGDFNLFPKQSLQTVENALKNKEFDRENIKHVIEAVYSKERIESPGVEPEDIAKTIIEAR